MAITRVGSYSAGGAASVTSVTVTLPQAATAGNVILVAVSAQRRKRSRTPPRA